MERPTDSFFGDYLAIARRRSALLLLFCPTVLLIAVILAFKLPAVYRSSGTILLEASTVSQDLIRSTVVPAYADQEIELLRGRVMGLTRLSELVEQTDPYPNRPDLSVRDKAGLIAGNTEIERVDPITLEPLLESTAFSIHYHNPSPEVAQKVATAIVNLFLAYNLETRTQNATDTVAFLTEQASRLEIDIAAAEAALAEFKQEHASALPDSQNMNQNQLERAERELLDYAGRIRETEDRQALLRLQLNETPPSLVVAAGATRADLALLTAQLAAARQRYTEEHPDVRRLVRAIELLQQNAATQNSAQRPDNPAYLQISEQLAAVARSSQRSAPSAQRCGARSTSSVGVCTQPLRSSESCCAHARLSTSARQLPRDQAENQRRRYVSIGRGRTARRTFRVDPFSRHTREAVQSESPRHSSTRLRLGDRWRHRVGRARGNVGRHDSRYARYTRRPEHAADRHGAKNL